jgi:hypothetical protein
MVTLRTRQRKDGTEYTSVLYRHNGKQSSLSFDDHAAAVKFRDVIDRYGVERALATVGVDQAQPTRGLTVEAWLTRHIDHLTGVAPWPRQATWPTRTSPGPAGAPEGSVWARW